MLPGMMFRDPASKMFGRVTGSAVMGDGKPLARIGDRWFFLECLEAI